MSAIDQALTTVAFSIDRESKVNSFDIKGAVFEYRVANFKRYHVAFVQNLKIKQTNDKFYEPVELYQSLKDDLKLARRLKGEKFSETEVPNKSGTDKTGKNELAELNDEDNYGKSRSQ